MVPSIYRLLVLYRDFIRFAHCYWWPCRALHVHVHVHVHVHACTTCTSTMPYCVVMWENTAAAKCTYNWTSYDNVSDANMLCYWLMWRNFSRVISYVYLHFWSMAWSWGGVYLPCYATSPPITYYQHWMHSVYVHENIFFPNLCSKYLS